MKAKILFLVAFLAAYACATAQLNEGAAVITRGGALSTDKVVNIFEVGNTTSAPLGDGWPWGSRRVGAGYTNWEAGNLGQVFGIATKTGTNPLIYVSTAQVYRYYSTITYTHGYRQIQGMQPGNTTRRIADGTPIIWQLTPSGGAAPLVVSTDNALLPGTQTNEMYNLGTCIGNICYDEDNQQIFATNMEDGRIYRIDASGGPTNGNVLSRYDPFGTYAAPAVNDKASFIGFDERLWGIAYHNGRLYFSRCREDLGNPSLSKANEIYSVAIDNSLGGTGDFIVSGQTGPEYVQSLPLPTIWGTTSSASSIPPIKLLPDGTNPDIPYSNPIADIEISDDGNTMLVAERTMSGMINNDADQWINWAHKSRILRYDLVSGAWQLSSNDYFVGNAYGDNYNQSPFSTDRYFSTNSCGGVDFSADETLVWGTGDGLKLQSTPGGSPGHTAENVYGIAGIPVGGNTVYENPPISSSCTNVSSIYNDIYATPSSATGRKALTGDVDIFHNICSNPPVVTAVTYNASCFGECDGAVYLNVNGENIILGAGGQYDYEWSNGASDSYLGGLCPGSYSVMVTDEDGCTGTATGVVSQPAELDIHAEDCANANGELNVTPLGGTPPYTFLWGDGSTGSSITGQNGDSYAVTITDANNCSVVKEVTIHVVRARINFNFVNAIRCHGDCTGALTAAALEGQAPYAYSWNSVGRPAFSANTQYIDGLCAGTYNVTITDANGCTASATFELGQPDELAVGIVTTDETCRGGCNGTGTVTPSGGTPSYSYVWSDGNTTASANGLCAGTSFVTVTDAFNCTVTASATVIAGQELEGELTMPDTVCIGGSDTIRASGTGFGRLIFNDVDNTDIFSLSDGFVMPVTVSPTEAGTHKICLVIYSSDPDLGEVACIDTICKEVSLIPCGCDSVAGNAEMERHDLGNMKYGFNNAGSINASFINWYVDGVQREQTTGHGTFQYDFSQGGHVVCMEAAYILPGLNGHSVCCYDRVCDSIEIDLCEVWRATDYIKVLPGQTYRDVSFDFVGNMSPVPTIIWHFGDNTTTVQDVAGPMSHHYTSPGTYDVCAYIVWSNGEWTPEDMSVCCCVDTICFEVEITPCSVGWYDISAEQLDGPEPWVILSPMPPAGSTITWFLDESTVPLASGSSRFYNFVDGISGYHKVCAKVAYTVESDIPGEPDFACEREFCNKFAFGEERQPHGMLRYFPNPTKNMVTVEYAAVQGDILEISLMDQVGKIMKSKRKEASADGIDQEVLYMDDLASGLYLMKVAVSDKVETVKLIKQ